jgi:hypothetical protein
VFAPPAISAPNIRPAGSSDVLGSGTGAVIPPPAPPAVTGRRAAPSTGIALVAPPAAQSADIAVLRSNDPARLDAPATRENARSAPEAAGISPAAKASSRDEATRN